MRIRTIASRLLAVGIIVVSSGACRDRLVPTAPPATVKPDFVFSSATPLVNTTSDAGTGGCTVEECTLREALAFVDTGGTINFSVTGEIRLAQGELQIDRSMTIDGPGVTSLTISGHDSTRVLMIFVGDVHISNLTIAHGFTTETAGGGILNLGRLTLTNAALNANWVNNGVGASGGGGIHSSGPLFLVNSSVTGNMAGGSGNGWGGGVAADDTLQVTGSVISGNRAFNASGGGGIYAGGPTVITTTLISADSASAGGGMYLEIGNTLVDRSTLTANVGYEGGAIYSNKNGDFTSDVTRIVNSTISGNTSTFGAAVYNWNGLTTIAFSTLTGNAVSGTDADGGGVWSYNDGSTKVAFKGSIVVANTGGDFSGHDAATPFQSEGYNILGVPGNVGPVTPHATDTVSVTDAGLGTLAVNTPGTLATHALLAGSLAIDRVPTTSCTGFDSVAVTVDERGVTRPQGSACDAGAFELVTTVPFSSSCTFTINPKNDQRTATVTWANAEPGVTLLLVTGDGRIVQKAMTPTASGSLSLRVRAGTPSYELRGGTSRRDATEILAPAGSTCTQ